MKKQNKYIWLRPSKTRGVKGCFACEQDHFSKKRHSRDEITAAIERLNPMHRTVLLTVEDLCAMYGMMDDDDGEEAEDISNAVQWAEIESGDDDSIALIAYVEGELIRQDFAPAALPHIINVHRREKDDGHIICHDLKKENYSSLNGLRTDTWRSSTSVISTRQ